MASIKNQIIFTLDEAMEEMGIKDVKTQIQIPSDPKNGDYSSNIAMVALNKSSAKNPLDFASKIIEKIKDKKFVKETFSKVGAVRPGFINFWLSTDYLINSLIYLGEEKGVSFEDKKVLIEFAGPNTHKEFHIGHLRNIAIGESLSRLIEFENGSVFRTNYQGDIGPHVAKAIWAIGLKIKKEEVSIYDLEKAELTERIKFLGESYAIGSREYEENPQAKREIIEINLSLYKKEDKYLDLWRITRKWSLEYFDLLYKIFGTKFDRLFFESEVYEKGKEIIESHTDGIFKKDKGAIIFEGEKYGLHNRVFLTSEGYATYEGKEMALAILQYKTFPFDLALHVVAAEQEAYFKVVFKALELIDSKFKDREKHLSYGMVELKEGKMSSRAGNVVTALWLFEEAEKRIKKHFPNTDAKNVQQIAVGAVKYSLLKFSRTSNISFSFEESISLEGNSGPYLQYTFTRSQSIKRKAEELGIEPLFSSQKYLTEGEVVLLRYLSKFQDAVEESAKAFAPNILCNYLYELAQKYNIFYQKVPVLTSESKEFRLALNNAAGETIKKGLSLLGIAVPERM